MALGYESPRTALLKIKHVAVMDGGGNARTYWQEDMIQSPGLFFFFPPLLNKHQTAIRLVWQYHFLDFDNRWFPAASPPFTIKKKTNSQLSFQGNKTLCALNLQTSTDSRRNECLPVCLYPHVCIFKTMPCSVIQGIADILVFPYVE